MKSRRPINGPRRSHAVVLGTDDGIASGSTVFAQKHDLSASGFTGLGAFRGAVLGFRDLESIGYEHIAIDNQAISLVGDIALKDNEPKWHAHVVATNSTAKPKSSLGGMASNA